MRHLGIGINQIKLGKENFTHLDDCINANYNYESVRSRLASHPKNQSDNDNQHVDLAPIVFDLIQNTKENKTKTTAINTRKIRSNETVKILLDSGASASIVNHSYVHKNNFSTKSTTQQWSTMAGTFNTCRVASVNLILPELNSTAEIKINCHVSKQKSNYNLIVGSYSFNNNKDYGHKQEINSMVNEQVKKTLKKQNKKEAETRSQCTGRLYFLVCK